MANYISVYPPAHDTTYVKATSEMAALNQRPWYATDPAKSLTGGNISNSWRAVFGAVGSQRFHIDLGVPRVVRRIYYENAHNSGLSTVRGVQNFTFWGSNNAAAFAELTYGTDTNWTQLTTSQSTFDQHVAADQADPKYITVANSTRYRYYAIKCVDNYGDAAGIELRRIVMQLLSSRPQILSF